MIAIERDNCVGKVYWLLRQQNRYWAVGPHECCNPARHRNEENWKNTASLAVARLTYPNRNELQSSLQEAGMQVHIIGGADVASELDAKRAIRQAAELAAEI